MSTTKLKAAEVLKSAHRMLVRARCHVSIKAVDLEMAKTLPIAQCRTRSNIDNCLRDIEAALAAYEAMPDEPAKPTPDKKPGADCDWMLEAAYEIEKIIYSSWVKIPWSTKARAIIAKHAPAHLAQEVSARRLIERIYKRYKDSQWRESLAVYSYYELQDLLIELEAEHAQPAQEVSARELLDWMNANFYGTTTIEASKHALFEMNKERAAKAAKETT